MSQRHWGFDAMIFTTAGLFAVAITPAALGYIYDRIMLFKQMMVSDGDDFTARDHQECRSRDDSTQSSAHNDSITSQLTSASKQEEEDASDDEGDEYEVRNGMVWINGQETRFMYVGRISARGTIEWADARTEDESPSDRFKKTLRPLGIDNDSVVQARHKEAVISSRNGQKCDHAQNT